MAATPDSEQRINEMRVVQAETLHGLANPTFRISALTLMPSVIIKVSLAAFKDIIDQNHLNAEPVETFSNLGVAAGLGIYAVAEILRSAAESLETRIPEQMKLQSTWDRIRTKK